MVANLRLVPETHLVNCGEQLRLSAEISTLSDKRIHHLGNVLFRQRVDTIAQLRQGRNSLVRTQLALVHVGNLPRTQLRERIPGHEGSTASNRESRVQRARGTEKSQLSNQSLSGARFNTGHVTNYLESGSSVLQIGRSVSRVTSNGFYLKRELSEHTTPVTAETHRKQQGHLRTQLSAITIHGGMVP